MKPSGYILLFTHCCTLPTAAWGASEHIISVDCGSVHKYVSMVADVFAVLATEEASFASQDDRNVLTLPFDTPVKGREMAEQCRINRR